MPTVVLRQGRKVLGHALDPADAFARSLERALRRRLPTGWSLVEDGAQPDLRLQRDRQGGWSLMAGGIRIETDDLAVGAFAARHLAALGARDLRYAGAAGEGLRQRGFAIAAGALGCTARRLEDRIDRSEATPGIFADGEAAEAAALAACAAAGLAVPRDAFLLGVDDGAARPPRTPGIPRLRLDPEAVAALAIESLAQGLSGIHRVPPAGVATRAGGEDGDDRHLAAALAHLRAHLHRPLDVEALARAAGLPRRSLERRFREALGRSPLDEIRRSRVAQAQELLAHSDLPLAQIAARCGFSGADRLGVVFKQVIGATPERWRRQHRVGGSV